MIFGKYINRYYLRYLHLILLGAAALVVVDYAQLLIPDYQGSIVDSLIEGNLSMDYLRHVMLRFLMIAAAMFIGRFAWRVTIFGTRPRGSGFTRPIVCPQRKAIANLFHKNKVGAQMALYTNDLNAIRETLAWESPPW